MGQLQVPAGIVGVPDMAPVFGSTAIPEGKFEALQVKGGTPPDVWNESEKAVPIVAGVSDVVEIETAGGTCANAADSGTAANRNVVNPENTESLNVCMVFF
jgi:hypothetical protein